MASSTRPQRRVAEEWIRTDYQAVEDDVKRLGVVEAARYNRELIKEAAAKGDHRFTQATITALIDVLRSYHPARGPQPHGPDDTAARPSFDHALARWLEQCQDLINTEFAHRYPNLAPPTLVVERGRRYVRIVSDERTTRSAWAFIDTTNGDILKADSWKAPAKHARGNLFDPNPMVWISYQGPAYLRR